MMFWSYINYIKSIIINIHSQLERNSGSIKEVQRVNKVSRSKKVVDVI